MIKLDTVALVDKILVLVTAAVAMPGLKAEDLIRDLMKRRMRQKACTSFHF